MFRDISSVFFVTLQTADDAKHVELWDDCVCMHTDGTNDASQITSCYSTHRQRQRKRVVHKELCVES